MLEITKRFAESFAADWVTAWNSYDLKKIMHHYSDDFSIESPLAAKRFPDSNGRLKGKQAISAYWEIGLRSRPKLKFELIKVFRGVNSISILYLSQTRSQEVVEVMYFNNEMKVYKTCVLYE